MMNSHVKMAVFSDVLMFSIVCTTANNFYTICVFKQFAGLSSFPGVGMAQGLSSSLSFGQNLHPSGAFQPKVMTRFF